MTGLINSATRQAWVKVHTGCDTVHFFFYSTVLFNGPPKPKACWSSKSKALCEEPILTLGAQHDQDLNLGALDLDLSSLANELSCCSFLFGQKQTGYRGVLSLP